MISAEEFLAQHPSMSADGEPVDTAVRVSSVSTGDGDATIDRPARHRDGRGRASRWRRSVDGSVDDPRDFDACREAALRLLDAAARPSGALRERLLDKGYDENVVDAVVERLICVNLVDDELYARSAVRGCCDRLLGARGALSDLMRKGVDRECASHAVREADERGEFEDAAWELGRRYAAKTAGLDPVKRVQRFWAAGGRKGHDPEMLRRIASELF